MSEEILINITPKETRVAVVENGMVQELHIERGESRGVLGNIYKGKVVRIMPGMQAAFVDIGLERAAFLHANEVYRPSPSTGLDEVAPDNGGAVPSIVTLLHNGQDIVVQVLKDPIGSKGARLTMHLSIPSRYLVLLPQTHTIGISAKIEDEDERVRLKALIDEVQSDDRSHGYIVRTNAEGQGIEALSDDIAYLGRIWAVVERRGREAAAGACIYEELTLPQRAVRDMIGKDVHKVSVDSRVVYEQLCGFVDKYMPVLLEKIELYTGARPIFDLYGVEDDISRALNKQVPLKSGGYLVIDQTEAMTTVDVNTGSFLGQRNLEETVYRTNLEAAQALARQLRLRNLGGIIIIDFIDMEDAEHRRQVLRTLEKSLARDHAKTTVYDFSPLGLVEMTRKRTVDSLARQLSEPCPSCNGRGMIKTAETVTYEIFREIVRAVRQFEAARLLVIASPQVVHKITEDESTTIAELEEFLSKSIRFQADEQYMQEQFDVVLL